MRCNEENVVTLADRSLTVAAQSAGLNRAAGYYARLVPLAVLLLRIQLHAETMLPTVQITINASRSATITGLFAQARILMTRSDGYLLHQFHVDRYRDPAGLSDIFRKDPIAPPVALLEGDTITVLAGCSTRDPGVDVLFGLWIDGTSF